MISGQKRVITIGNFDGVHLGHQEILKKTSQIAREQKLESLVLTFKPNPKEFFNKIGFFDLCSLDQKIILIQKQGIDLVEVIKFNDAFASLNARIFVKDYLVEKFKVQTLVLGNDFAFGKNQHAKIPEIRDLAKEFGFKLIVVNKFKHGNMEISSSMIRDFLKNKDIQKANQLLGRV